MEEQLADVYKTATNYPDLVFKLITIGVQSYTVEVGAGSMLYRFDGGEHVLHGQPVVVRQVAGQLNEALVIQALKANQQGKTTYPEFLNDIAQAGVLLYEATLTGNLRVTYIGAGGFYEEVIPLQQPGQ